MSAKKIILESESTKSGAFDEIQLGPNAQRDKNVSKASGISVLDNQRDKTKASPISLSESKKVNLEDSVSQKEDQEADDPFTPDAEMTASYFSVDDLEKTIAQSIVTLTEHSQIISMENERLSALKSTSTGGETQSSQSQASLATKIEPAVEENPRSEAKQEEPVPNVPKPDVLITPIPIIQATSSEIIKKAESVPNVPKPDVLITPIPIIQATSSEIIKKAKQEEPAPNVPKPDVLITPIPIIQATSSEIIKKAKQEESQSEFKKEEQTQSSFREGSFTKEIEQNASETAAESQSQALNPTSLSPQASVYQELDMRTGQELLMSNLMSNLKIAERRLCEFESENAQLRSDNEKLSLSTEALQEHFDKISESNRSMKMDYEESNQNTLENKKVLENSLRDQSKEIESLTFKLDHLQRSLKKNLFNMRVKERELANRLEIKEHEISVVVKEKDILILELKSKIDLLNRRLEVQTEKLEKLEDEKLKESSHARSAVRALQVSLDYLRGAEEEESDVDSNATQASKEVEKKDEPTSKE